MKIKNRKLLTLIMIVVLVLSQSLVVFADWIPMGPIYDASYFYEDNTYSNEFRLCVYDQSLKSSTGLPSSEFWNYKTYSSDSEVVIYLTTAWVDDDSDYKYSTGVLSNSPISSKGRCVRNRSSDGLTVIEENQSFSYSPNGSYNTSTDAYAGYFLYSDMKVFNSKASAQAYLDTGNLDGLVQGASEQYNADEIYLDNFYFEVHDSNSLEEFYITFYYTPSDYLVENGGSVLLDYNLTIDFDWFSGAFECSSVSLGGTLELPCGSGEMVYSWDISADDFWEINEGGNFFEILGDTWTNEFIEEAILGDEVFIDFDGISIGEFGGNSFIQIENSSCDINVYPVLDNQRGKTYTGTIDFLNPQNSYYSSNTPDSNGNYVSDGNYTQQDGYYYTEVSQDSYGNNTYNYYYITDNSRTEIDSGSSGGGSGTGIQHHYHEHKWEGSVNVNVNGSFGGGSSSGDNVTIEDDDLSADGLRSAIEDGYGLFDLVSTEKDNDGFLSLLTAFMGSLDDDMSNLIGFGMGTTVALALLLRLLNR